MGVQPARNTGWVHRRPPRWPKRLVRRIASGAIPVLLGMSVVSCGSQSHEGRLADWCPTSTTPVELAKGKPSRPTSHSFDAALLIGQKQEHASKMASRWGCFLRVTEIDGHKFALLADFRANRIDVVVRRGRIIKVGSG